MHKDGLRCLLFLHVLHADWAWIARINILFDKFNFVCAQDQEIAKSSQTSSCPAFKIVRRPIAFKMRTACVEYQDNMQTNKKILIRTIIIDRVKFNIPMTQHTSYR